MCLNFLKPLVRSCLDHVFLCKTVRICYIFSVFKEQAPGDIQSLELSSVISLTVALYLGPSGTETSESYLSRQDNEIGKNYPKGTWLKFQDVSVGPIKFFEKKFYHEISISSPARAEIERNS